MSDDTLIYVYGLWSHGPPGCPDWIESAVARVGRELSGQIMPVNEVLKRISAALPDDSLVQADEMAGRDPGMITASFGRLVECGTITVHEFNWRVLWFHVKSPQPAKDTR